ncbi:MAG: hypothetical protein ACRC4M_04275 [Mycoplasma sp.]
MKIKKEFIPLILSGEKKYEFRKKEDLESIYKIGNEYFELKFICCSDKNTLIEIKGKTKKISYYCERVWTRIKYPITKQEYDFLKSYIEIDKPIYIYEWKKVKIQELEIIE